MIILFRTDSENPEFQRLVVDLDRELSIRDGEEHGFYAQFNKIDSLRHVVVAFDGTVAVGCGAMKPFVDDDSVEIKRMFVPFERRGRGIAGHVLGELERWATELGFKRGVLETGHKQPEAIALYLRCGYSVIPNYGQYQGLENSVCFAKTISDVGE